MSIRSLSHVVAHSPLRWQRELLHLTIAAMEAVWCTAIFIAFSPGASQLATPIIAVFVFANLLISVSLVRFLTLRHVPYKILRWIVLAGLVVASAFNLFVFLPVEGRSSAPLIIGSFSSRPQALVPPALLAVAVMIFLWYRGIRVGTTLITPVRASFGFRLGILVMILLCLIPNNRLQSDLISLLPLFFYMGLLAAALARAASLRLNRDAQRSSFGAGWLGFTGALGAIVSGTGFLIALLLAGFGVEGAARILRGIFGAIFVVFVVIVTPILYVLEWLLRPLAELIQSLALTVRQSQFQNQFAQIPDASSSQNLRQLAILLDILKYLCLGLIILAVVAGLFMLLRNRATSMGSGGEDREDLENEGLMDGLRGLLRRGLGKLQNTLGALAQFGVGRDLLQALTIRRLYARLIVRATGLGFPRDPAQTPFEYQDKLRQAFPGFPSEVEMITQAYVNVHYGELPESREALSDVQNAVERMIASTDTAAQQGRV
jgi:hypothetical protein